MSKTKVGIGQDSHRFLPEGSQKSCIIGGVVFPEVPGLCADSDGDVVFHALCNAITSLTHVSILGEIAPKLCKEEGITDSRVYLEKALTTCQSLNIEHVAFSLEGARPRLQKKVNEIRASVAGALLLHPSQVGLTITSGNGLTAFGKGDGLTCTCILTATTRDHHE